MKITICGSMHHITKMMEAAKLLEKLGYEVVVPNPREGEVAYETLSDHQRSTLKQSLIQEHLDKINESDAILVYNEDKRGVAGYIGGNTLMEMAFAFAQKIEIFMLKTAPELSYADEILGMQPIVLDGDVEKLHDYFTSLPKVMISSKSPIKLRAISRGMRRAGIRTQVLARPTQSDVAEQPQTIDETYLGATNRHAALARETASERPAYLATIESGNHHLLNDHNTFGLAVVILEEVGGMKKIGVNLELEFPKAMTDKVPSVYPDLGVLVQQEYGSTLKDPFPFFTDGKVTRLKLVESAVFNVASQISTSHEALDTKATA